MRWQLQRTLRRVNFYGNRRSYQDEAFSWARENPQLARDCLSVAPPPSTTQSAAVEPTERTSLVDSLETYLSLRQWEVDSSIKEDEKQLEYAKRLVSHVLSAPLTLAQHLRSMNCASSLSRLCCVGARAEATLPTEFWRELLFARSFMAVDDCATSMIRLDFVGPDVQKQSPVNLSLRQASLQLQWSFRGYLHDFQTKPEWDAFVLFNPGGMATYSGLHTSYR